MNELFTCTDPIDKSEATKAVNDFYEFCKKPLPEIVFVAGPVELREKIDLSEEGLSLFDYQDIAHFTSCYSYTTNMRLSRIYNSVFSDLRAKQKPGKWVGSDIMLTRQDYDRHSLGMGGAWDVLAAAVCANSYACFTFQKRCFIVDRPKYTYTNDRGFHCTTAPALVFRDGAEVYCYEGIEIKKEHLLNPSSMSLKDIHSYRNSNKHLIIGLFGVDNYLELAKQWKPDVAGKFKKFFHFSEIVVPGDNDIEESWKKKGRAHHYKEEPLTVNVRHGRVNGEHGLVFEDSYKQIDFFKGYRVSPLDTERGKELFDEGDRELLDLLNFEEIMNRGCTMGFQIGFQNDKFFLKQTYDRASCYHDVVPSWFKAKMFRGQDALYETDKYAVKFENGELQYAGDINMKKPIFRGSENLPYYEFKLDLESDTWEGFLEKWARLSFEWLEMCEDSLQMS